MKSLMIWIAVAMLPLSAFATEPAEVSVESALPTDSGTLTDAPTAAIVSLSESELDSQSELRVRIEPFLGLGGALLFESANDRRYQTSVAPPLLAIGARFGWQDGDVSSASSSVGSPRWSAKIEYANAETRDGNATISLYRKRESWLLWISRDLGRAQGWVPYVALAAGASRRDVETRVGEELERLSGGWLGTAAAGAGFRANWSQSVTAKFEFRCELGDAQKFSEKTNDARLGVAAIIETMF